MPLLDVVRKMSRNLLVQKNNKINAIKFRTAAANPALLNLLCGDNELLISILECSLSFFEKLFEKFSHLNETLLDSVLQIAFVYSNKNIEKISRLNCKEKVTYHVPQTIFKKTIIVANSY